ncbi:hypothetical protein PFISCL1PPCAC_23540, partial [Pristionchus fissidentatus]
LSHVYMLQTKYTIIIRTIIMSLRRLLARNFKRQQRISESRSSVDGDPLANDKLGLRTIREEENQLSDISRYADSSQWNHSRVLTERVERLLRLVSHSHLAHDVSEHQTGTAKVDSDSLLNQIRCHLYSQLIQSGLGNGVVGFAGSDGQGGDGRHVDNGSFRLLEMRNGEL